MSDKYIHHGGPRFSWDNGQKGVDRRLARLDRLYTLDQSKLNIQIGTYYIHGYSVGSDHSLVHLELHIGSGECKKSAFKWNISHLKGDILAKMEEKWNGMPE